MADDEQLTSPHMAAFNKDMVMQLLEENRLERAQRKEEMESNRKFQEGLLAVLQKLHILPGADPISPTPATGSTAPLGPPTPVSKLGEEASAIRAEAGKQKQKVQFSTDSYTPKELYSTPTGLRAERNVSLVPAADDSESPETRNYRADVKVPFPKFDSQDIDMFLIEAGVWFKQHSVMSHTHRVAYVGSQLEGPAREWYRSKLRVDPEMQGELHHNWDMFAQRLREQFGRPPDRFSAYQELVALQMRTDAPGSATRYVEQFRDLEGRAHVEDQELLSSLFRRGLTRSTREKFERNPPQDIWGWYKEVESIDRIRILNANADRLHVLPTRPTTSDRHEREREAPRAVMGRSDPRAGGAPPFRAATDRVKPPADRAPPPHLPQRAAGYDKGPTTFAGDTCRNCGGTGHWVRDCPTRLKTGPTPARTPFNRQPGPRQGRTFMAMEPDGDEEDQADDERDPETERELIDEDDAYEGGHLDLGPYADREEAQAHEQAHEEADAGKGSGKAH